MTRHINFYFCLAGAFFLSVSGLMAKSLTLNLNSAETIHLGENIAEIFVANPEIADVQLNSPTVAYVFGKKTGTTTIFGTNSKGQTVIHVEVDVQHETGSLKKVASAQGIPEREITTVSTPGGIVVQGELESARDAAIIDDAATQVAGPSEKVINQTRITTPTQVYLRVKIAEISRSVLNKLDINWGSAISSPSHFTFGILSGSRAPISSSAFNRLTTKATNSLGIRFNDGVTDLANLIDVLNQEKLASLLAEPNLVALSGQTASFLAGGEIPYPVPQDQSISIQFKKVGISLSFTPTVLSPGLINLRVSPEVSEVDNTNAISIVAAGTTVTVPAIKTRRAETCVELASGQSLAIAGLFSRSVSNQIDAIPALGELPILGALFKSTDFQRSENELVIIVTPYLVQPSTEGALALPTDTLHHASNLEMLLFNKLNRDDLARKEMSGEMRLVGAAGFYLD